MAFILQVSRAVLSFHVGNMEQSGKMTHSVILSSSCKNTAIGGKTQGHCLHLGKQGIPEGFDKPRDKKPPPK